MNSGLKRAAIVVGILVGALGAGVTLATWFVNRDSVRAAVVEQIARASGLDLVVAGETQVSIVPFGKVSFHDVSLRSDRDEPALAIDSLTANLRLLPLLLQRVEIAHIQLERPRATIVREEKATNWAGIADKLSQALKPTTEKEKRISFSEIRVNNGTLRYVDPSRGVVETLSDIDSSLAWPSISRSFGALSLIHI